MNQDDDLSLVQAESFGGFLVIHALNVLYLQEVVAAAQSANLRPSTFLGPGGNSLRVGVRQCASCFGVLRVVGLSVAMTDHPAGTPDKDVVKFFRVDLDVARAAGSAGDIAKRSDRRGPSNGSAPHRD